MPASVVGCRLQQGMVPHHSLGEGAACPSPSRRSQPTPAWAVTFLCWLKQEVGWGAVFDHLNIMRACAELQCLCVQVDVCCFLLLCANAAPGWWPASTLFDAEATPLPPPVCLSPAGGAGPRADGWAGPGDRGAHQLPRPGGQADWLHVHVCCACRGSCLAAQLVAPCRGCPLPCSCRASHRHPPDGSSFASPMCPIGSPATSWWSSARTPM